MPWLQDHRYQSATDPNIVVNDLTVVEDEVTFSDAGGYQLTLIIHEPGSVAEISSISFTVVLVSLQAEMETAFTE